MLKVAWSSLYAHPLPEDHRFPMIKYELIPEQLIYEGTITETNLFEPCYEMDRVAYTYTHKGEYIQKCLDCSLSYHEMRRIGFPLSKQLIDREINICNGTVQAACYAMQYGAAINVAGGTHHAYSNRGEGFCIFNDQALAAHYLIHYTDIKKVLIVDLDVHQGNGTAEIFADENRVYTFSMHAERNFPFHKEKSDLDIPLKDYTGDAEYLRLLSRYLSKLIDDIEPAFIFYQAGVDVLSSDKLGRMGLTIQGCKERDKMVFGTAKKHKLPVVACMGGGYADSIRDIVEAHANTYRVCQEVFF